MLWLANLNRFSWTSACSIPQYKGNMRLLQVVGSTVRAVVERESQNKCEPYTPMAFAEICRHIANVGELACAAANPVKERHFYLAITGSFQLAEAAAGEERRLCT